MKEIDKIVTLDSTMIVGVFVFYVEAKRENATKAFNYKKELEVLISNGIIKKEEINNLVGMSRKKCH